jgi:NADPH-dependent 2,4-dienoyl-CoA reductase/sulfur reductase-like enzyme
MFDYHYLIIGGGMTADAAVRGIRALDPTGSIGLIGRESDPPYDRPPLSKKLWQGKPIEQIWRKTEDRDVRLHLGRSAVALNLGTKAVWDDRGDQYRFVKLLLATGGSPRRFPFGGDDILYFRTLDDYRRLRALSDKKRRFAVIGGGFIGSEIAAALAMNGRDVTMIFPEDSIGARVFPGDLGQFLNQFYREKGVEVLNGQTITGLDREPDRLVLRLRSEATASETSIDVDGVVAGIGIEPETKLAQDAGLPVEGGIVVDEQLHAGHPDVYAAGDVARFRNPILKQSVRFEHEDNALAMGERAGRNMAGESEAYDRLPFFYSDLFELGYEAVGELDSRLETVADWVQPFRTGVVYYLHDDRVRGVLLWNAWDRVESARALMSEKSPVVRSDLIGRL